MKSRGRNPTKTLGGLRLCKGCTEWKPLDQFSGRNVYCLSCNADRSWRIQMDKRSPNEIIVIILHDMVMLEKKKKYLKEKYGINVREQT